MKSAVHHILTGLVELKVVSLSEQKTKTAHGCESTFSGSLNDMQQNMLMLNIPCVEGI